LKKIVFSLGYEILFVRCSVRDIDDLQEPRVGEAFRRTRELENSKVQRRLQRERHVQPAGVWPNVDFYLAESSRLLQSRNRICHLRVGVRLAVTLLHQRSQRLDRNSGIGDQLHCRNLLAFIGNFVALAGLLALGV
jgi:hypothetical protein